MPDQETIRQQQSLLRTHRRTLAHYIDQYAKLGSAFAPPGVAHGIAEARDNIRQIKHVLRRWGVTVEDLPGEQDPEAGDVPEEETSNLPPDAGRRPALPLPPAQAEIGLLRLHLVSDGKHWRMEIENLSGREVTQVGLRFRAPAGVFATPLATRVPRILPGARVQAGKITLGDGGGQPVTLQVNANYWLSGLEQPERADSTITVALA